MLGYDKTSPIFVANGVAMAITFFAVRIAVMPPYWLKVYSVYGTEPFNRLGHIQLVLVVTCAVLDVINLFWFYKIYTGARRVLEMFLNSSGAGTKPVKEDGHAGDVKTD